MSAQEELDTPSRSQINDVLPFEVLSNVFIFAIPSYDAYRTNSRKNPDTALIIAQVCRTWKDIAWNTAQLWTFVVFDLKFKYYDEPLERLKQRLKGLDGWLSRSGDLPLSVSVVDYMGRYKASIPAMEFLFSHLQQYSLRCQNFNAHIFMRGLAELRKFLQQAVNLRSLSLKFFYVQETQLGEAYFALANLHRFATVSLNKFQPKWLSVDWAVIKHLRLRFLRIDESLKMLSSTSNLVRLNIRFIRTSGNPVAVPADPIILPHLLYFDWDYGLTQDDTGADNPWLLLEKLNTPALRVFRWSARAVDVLPSSLEDFITCIANSLRLLILGYGDDQGTGDDVLLRLWTLSPHSTVLRFPANRVVEERAAVPCITDDMVHLYRNPQAERWSSVVCFLPWLEDDQLGRPS